MIENILEDHLSGELCTYTVHVALVFFFVFCFFFRKVVRIEIQCNFNGFNIFATMKICSRQGKFELMSVNQSAKSKIVIIWISFRFSLRTRNVVCSHKNRLIEAILMRTPNIPFSIYRVDPLYNDTFCCQNF